MIDDHERDGVIPLLEAVQKIQRAFPRFRSQHAVPLLVMLLQIALDGAKNIKIVVDGQDHWLLHIAIYRRCFGFDQRAGERRFINEMKLASSKLSDPSCGTSCFVP